MTYDPSSKSPDPASASRKPRRPFFWRAILFLMFPVVIFLCWFLPKWHRANVQRQVVEYLHEQGRWLVIYDSEDYKFKFIEEEPAGTRWAGKIFGRDFFRRVTFVTAAGFWRCNDRLELVPAKFNVHDSLHKMAELPDLVRVDISRGDVTDADIEPLKNLRQLKSLDLHGIQITDVGLKNIIDLEHLEFLDISDTKSSFAGVYRDAKSVKELQAKIAKKLAK